ncbi:hypothetical protein [Streptomyces halobius]|uniref:Uncharacterized protein n=1 Tax=Streptomyces halobius TaxID=2879846 RepID=A0ABY4M0C0_9ACTN|nr:hypothetical protein [Streptomyces halobius]UQA90663.1 hypothetical protein K9S39_01025 [Streptomyces halobius]
MLGVLAASAMLATLAPFGASAAQAQPRTGHAHPTGVSARTCIKGGGKVMRVNAKLKVCVGGRYGGQRII